MLPNSTRPNDGIVPEKPVAFAGDDKGDDGLDVSLVEVDHAAFQVDPAGGVLAHAVEAFAVPRREMQFALEQTVAHRLEHARAGLCA